MRIPTIRGVIDRRILANFRVDPAVLSKVLPDPFRPQLFKGFGIAGICLIRLKHVRPKLFPKFVGIGSENAAHRIAVQWESDGQLHTGVYIPRRDTSSLLNTLAGGRIFPGVHYRARFDVEETENLFNVSMTSRDGSGNLVVESTLAESLPSDSIFDSVSEVSDFFESGSVGYSPANIENDFDGLELRAFNWEVLPLNVTKCQSSFFENRDLFPAGSIEFDNALLMRGIEHEWHSRDRICCSSLP